LSIIEIGAAHPDAQKDGHPQLAIAQNLNSTTDCVSLKKVARLGAPFAFGITRLAER
jgi:hypothetical protein